MTVEIEDRSLVATFAASVGGIDSRHQVILKMFADSTFPTRRMCTNLANRYRNIAEDFSRVAKHTRSNVEDYELEAFRQHCQLIAATDWKVVNLYFKKPRRVEPEGMRELLKPITFVVPTPPPKQSQYQPAWRSW